MTDRDAMLSQLIALHAATEKMSMTSSSSAYGQAIGIVAKGAGVLAVSLDRYSAPPASEVWFYDGDGNRHVLGEKTPPATFAGVRWI